MKTFDIPISENYVNNWGIVEALREIRANAEDGAKEENNFGIEYNPIAQEVIIWNRSSGKLTPASLVLGASTKNEGDANIGQFGEGYKLALVVLLREGKQVIIHNRDEIWTASFRDSKVYGTQTLHIDIEHNPSDNTTIMFTILDVTPKEFASFEDTLLSTVIDKLELIYEEKGSFRVYNTKGIEAEHEKLKKDRKLELEMLKSTLTSSDYELQRKFYWEEVRKMDTKMRRIQGSYVGGQYVQGNASTMTIDYSPKAVKLNRDRDRLEDNDWQEQRAIALALTTNIKNIRIQDAEFLNNPCFIKEFSDVQRTELRGDLLKTLGLPEETKTIIVNSRHRLKEEAEELGIDLPKNLRDIDYNLQGLLQLLGIKMQEFEHPILMQSMQQILKDFRLKHMAVFMQEGNEVLLKEINILKEVAESSYRGV